MNVVQHDGVQVVKNVMIPMADGTVLAGDLYMPPDADLDGTSGTYPCVLEYIPYRKDSEGSPSGGYDYLPRHGYVVARVDCRGTGASQGVSVDEYTPIEQADGYEVVEWLAEQSWCDGQINMIGISYGGFTSLQVAATQPPHLRSIIPIDFTDRRYTDDVHYDGGLLRMWCDPAYYCGIMTPFNALPPDPRHFDGDWAGLWREHLDAEPWILKWLRHQTEGDYWFNGSVGRHPERVQCPVFMITGWADAYPSCALRLAEDLDVPWKLLVGPWDHRTPDKAIPGPRLDYLRDVVRWLDHWCGRGETGIMDEPAVTAYMQRFDVPSAKLMEKSGDWRCEAAWPPAEQHDATLFLGERGRLGFEPDPEEGHDVFSADPRVGVTRGLVSGGQPVVLSVDQRADEALSLVYTSEPLEHDLPILGWPRVQLRVASSATVVAFVATLSEVGPDGHSAMVSRGVLNATRRHSLESPEPVVPGETMDLDLQLQATGWTFTKGNRLRLSISSADFPNLWPTPEVATNTVFRGPAASQLVLPVVPIEAPLPTPYLAPSSVDAMASFGCDPVWNVKDDILTGARTVELGWEWGGADSFGADRLRVEAACRVEPDRPEEASVHARTVVRARYGALDLEASSQVVIQGTATHLHAVIDLVVTTNGVQHATRHWAESVPRQLL